MVNTTNSKWQVGFWRSGGGLKYPVQFSWFEAVGYYVDIPIPEPPVHPVLRFLRQVSPIRFDRCPVSGKVISITFLWLPGELFVRFRPFHPSCVGYTVSNLEAFHQSKWYHHPYNKDR